MKLQMHTTATAPEQSRAVLDGIAADLGFVPNLAAATAESPTLLTVFDSLRRAVAGGQLDPAHREVAGLATAVAANNRYGVAFHSTVLAGMGVDESDIEAMRAGSPPEDARCAVVYDVASAIVIDRGRVDDALIDRARTLGFSDADILEVVAECAFASLVGLVDNLADRVELDPFLKARAWS